MPFSLDVTKEDFTSFRYNRKVHLLFLVTMAVLTLVVAVLLCITSPIDSTSQLGELFFLVLYILCWWLRGHEKCASYFPAFHYITLMIEYVSHCLTVLFSCILLLSLLVHALGVGESLLILVVVLFLLMLVFYAYIVFKMTPSVITILRGSPAEKEDVGREICGLAAGVPPGGSSAGGKAQPLPVKVQIG